MYEIEEWSLAGDYLRLKIFLTLGQRDQDLETGDIYFGLEMIF
jgi:hypothetical protein